MQEQVEQQSEDDVENTPKDIPEEGVEMVVESESPAN